MNVFVIAIFCIFITTIYAEFNVIYQIPNSTMSINTHEFIIEIDHEVNRPKFSTYIHIHKNATAEEFYKINTSPQNNNTIYDNKTLKFHVPDDIKWNVDTEYYIALDEGVLYSGNTTNSTAQIDSKFWNLKCVADDKSSIVTTTVFTIVNSSSNTLINGTDATTSSTILRILSTGEPSPTRSAQLGMGLGITFIGIIIIGEIIYFKYCYRSNLRSGNYLPEIVS